MQREREECVASHGRAEGRLSTEGCAGVAAGRDGSVGEMYNLSNDECYEEVCVVGGGPATPLSLVFENNSKEERSDQVITRRDGSQLHR